MPILVVDENAVTRKLISGILNKNGYETAEAEDGAEAAAKLASQPRVIVTTEHTDITRLKFSRILVLKNPVEPAALLFGVAQMLSSNGNVRAADKKSPEAFMRRAIQLSQEKMEQNCGGPFGAVIVKDGEIVGEGWNQVTSTNDPTAHAEVNAIRAACAAMGTFDLKGCEIYTSCEPCPMCLAAIYWARLDRVFFANTRQDAEKIGFDDDFIYREFATPESKRKLPVEIMMRDEAIQVFDNWMSKQDKTEY